MKNDSEKLQAQQTLITNLQQWLTTDRGQYLLSKEREAVNNLLKRLPGEILMQFGLTNDNNLYGLEKPFYGFCVTPGMVKKKKVPIVQASFNQLPVLPNSIDVILLPHVLENLDNYEEILTAIRHCLAPGGHLIVMSFNLWSLWSLSAHLGNRLAIPKGTQFLDIYRLRKWLSHAKFDNVEQETVGFSYPLKTMKRIKKLTFLETLGCLVWQNYGAITIVLAKKQTLGAIPPSVGHKKRVKIPSGYVNPIRNAREIY